MSGEKKHKPPAGPPVTAYELAQWIIRSRKTGLSIGAKYTLADLAGRSQLVEAEWVSWPSIETLMEDLELESPRSVKRLLKELREANVIRQIPWEKTELPFKRCRTDEFWIKFPKGDKFVTYKEGDKSGKGRVTKPATKGDKSGKGRVTSVSPEEIREETNKEIREENTIPPAVAEGCEREIPSIDFEDFWEAYPKQKSPEPARKAWKKHVTNQELAQTILAHVRDRAAKDPEWYVDDGRWIPLPANFLNDKRWNDSYGKHSRKRVFAPNQHNFQKHDPNVIPLTPEEREISKKRFDDLCSAAGLDEGFDNTQPQAIKPAVEVEAPTEIWNLEAYEEICRLWPNPSPPAFSRTAYRLYIPDTETHEALMGMARHVLEQTKTPDLTTAQFIKAAAEELEANKSAQAETAVVANG